MSPWIYELTPTVPWTLIVYWRSGSSQRTPTVPWTLIVYWRSGSSQRTPTVPWTLIVYWRSGSSQRTPTVPWTLIVYWRSGSSLRTLSQVLVALTEASGCLDITGPDTPSPTTRKGPIMVWYVYVRREGEASLLEYLHIRECETEDH
jgi:hypothetical protein